MPTKVWREINILASSGSVEVSPGESSGITLDPWLIKFTLESPLRRRTVSEFLSKESQISHVADLLFFNRLTEAKLPEETYHTWSWVSG